MAKKPGSPNATETVEAAGKLIAQALVLLMGMATLSAAAPVATPSKTAPKKKPPVEEEEELDLEDADEEEETEEESEEEETDEEEETEEESEEEETEEEEEAPTLSKQDVIAASAKCAKRMSREHVAKIFKKFGARGVNDIKKADYAKVISALKK